MTDTKQPLRLSFLRIVEIDAGSFVGGVLVTNQLGRPLEFQCTTPVRPNRTQEILYGATLYPFLFSEVIGKTLLDRLNNLPDVVLVSQPELLDLRRVIEAPVACIAEDGEELPDVTRIQLGRQLLRTADDYPDDVDVIRERCGKIPRDADLSEPLERVAEALQEAMRTAA